MNGYFTGIRFLRHGIMIKTKYNSGKDEILIFMNKFKYSYILLDLSYFKVRKFIMACHLICS